MLIRRKTFPLLVNDFLKHPALMWLAGFFLIFLSGLILFNGSQTYFITILSSLIFLKGAIYILAPEVFTKYFAKSSKAMVITSGIVVLLLGVIALWLGFV